MFDQIKKFFAKTFVSEIPEKEEVPAISEKTPSIPQEDPKPEVPENFEPSYIEPSSEPVIKKTKRSLKYRF
jgi:hypothetical protein